MEKITGHNYLGVVADEGPPALFGVRRAHRTVFAKVLADGAWGDPNGELQLQLVERCVPHPRSDSPRPSPGSVSAGPWVFEACQEVVISSARGDRIPCGANE